MKALILAAGRSSRLYPLTTDTPKPLLKIGDDSIIGRCIRLIESAGISDVLVVVGFHQDKIREALDHRVRFIVNPFYETTNNMASLWLAMPHLAGEEFIYLHGDVIYHQALLQSMIAGPGKDGISLLVDFGSVDEEAMKVRTNNGRFTSSSKEIPLDEAAGEWVGMARITSEASPALYSTIEGLLSTGSFQSYDTAAFNLLAERGLPFDLIPTKGQPWCEIDTKDDLDRARSMFARRDVV